MIDVVAASADHIRPLVEAMRQQERDEIAALGFAPLEGMQWAFGRAVLAWTGMADGEPACMFGVNAPSFVSREGWPWLLSTDGILAHQHARLRRNREILPLMLAAFPVLRDMVDARNTVSIRWLRWLGFTIGEPVPWGMPGELFHPFQMEA